jgi:YjbE family integral membrane protein
LDLTLFSSILSIIVINVVLSGDNAVVIAMVSRTLRPRERKRAIVAGGLVAIVLRVAFTALATLLLDIPLLQFSGGLLLVWVAYRLLADEGGEHDISASGTLWGAVQTIILADVLMSLDNILAVGGASHGHFRLLIFGLVTSMPLILLGSSLIARMMARFGWLAVIGALILALTSARMVADDQLVRHVVHGTRHVELLLLLTLVFSLIVVWPVVQRYRADVRDHDFQSGSA